MIKWWPSSTLLWGQMLCVLIKRTGSLRGTSVYLWWTGAWAEWWPLPPPSPPGAQPERSLSPSCPSPPRWNDLSGWPFWLRGGAACKGRREQMFAADKVSIRSGHTLISSWYLLQGAVAETAHVPAFFFFFASVKLTCFFFPSPWSSKERFVATSVTYLISSSLAKSMTTLALGFSLSRRMTLSNSVGLGSRGILTDWEMHTPPKHTKANSLNIKVQKSRREKKETSKKQNVNVQRIQNKKDNILLISCEGKDVMINEISPL